MTKDCRRKVKVAGFKILRTQKRNFIGSGDRYYIKEFNSEGNWVNACNPFTNAASRDRELKEMLKDERIILDEV